MLMDLETFPQSLSYFPIFYLVDFLLSYIQVFMFFYSFSCIFCEDYKLNKDTIAVSLDQGWLTVFQFDSSKRPFSFSAALLI